MSSPLLYPLVAGGARLVFPRLTPVEVRGTEHIPKRGGVLLLPNHQSALDPFVVQAWCPRRVRSMTKSTQFGTPFMGWIVPRLGGFPVRRYQVDPQSVRTVLRLLGEGECVCIYPEGERTWDGRLQPFRRGTLRVALRALQDGHTVIPVGLDGVFDLLPRGAGFRRPSEPVRVSFGEPIQPPPGLATAPGRAAREAALPQFRKVLTEALLRLSGEETRMPPPSWTPLESEPPASGVSSPL
jgi:1-acyl-sn-glycerol-3-phosphate acyltransferase